MRMLGVVAFAFGLAYPPLALADEVIAPVPAAIAFPAFAGKCFPAMSGIEVLGELKREHPDTRAFAMLQGTQQGFADAWRGMLHLPSVKIAVTLAWLASGVAAVSEYGPDGCLLTATVISGAQWNAIMAVLRRQRST